MADLYIMPSSGEGFGVVFLEAMYYGLPVIAGNADGSADALLNGKLGLLVPPGSVTGIKTAIENITGTPGYYLPSLSILQEHFSYNGYKRNIDMLLAGSHSQQLPNIPYEITNASL
jgi:glycosyltransferase involved in cell wall biosynthesis